MDDSPKESTANKVELLNKKIELLSNENTELKKLLKNEIAHKSSTASALHYQHSKEDALINSVPWIVFWVTHDLFYFDTNDFFAKIIGKTSNLIIDQKVGTLNESKELINTLESFNLSSSKTIIKEIKLPVSNSDRYYLFIMHKNIALRNFSAVGIDVTDKKQINELLKLKTEELEKILYISAHDLKSPIQSIENLLKWVEEDLAGKLSDETSELFNLLNNRVNRMDKILYSILKYHSIKEKEFTISKVNIKDSIISAFNKHNTKDRSVKLIFTTGMPIIETAEEPINYVLEALISNCLKHNPNKNLQIKVSSEILTKNYHSFKIKDNGSGIPTKYHRKVFEVFQTLRTKDDIEGCGMGLTIAKKYIELHKGNISIIPCKNGTEINFTWHN